MKSISSIYNDSELKPKFSRIYRNKLFLFIYTVIVFCFFYLVFIRNIPTDLQLHIKILEIYLTNSHFPDPPLYYVTLYLIHFLFLSNNFIYAAILVLSISCILKYNLVINYLNLGRTEIPSSKWDFLVFTLMFLSPIYIFMIDGNNWYLGKFTSSIWHNSTTIFVFPLCVWLFLESLKYLKGPNLFLTIKLLIISILILLAKPSFLLAFIVVFPIVCLMKFGWSSKYLLYTIILCMLTFISLIVEKKIIYNSNNALDKLIYNSEESHIIIAPFKVWLLWTKQPVLDIFSSFAFVISFLIIKYRHFKPNIEILYSLMLLLVSLLVFFIFAESGPRLHHGNFYWQIPISMLIVNMVLLKNLITGKRCAIDNSLNLMNVFKENKVIGVFYFLQFISGIFYMVKIVVTKNYY